MENQTHAKRANCHPSPLLICLPHCHQCYLSRHVLTYISDLLQCLGSLLIAYNTKSIFLCMASKTFYILTSSFFSNPPATDPGSLTTPAVTPGHCHSPQLAFAHAAVPLLILPSPHGMSILFLCFGV